MSEIGYDRPCLWVFDEATETDKRNHLPSPDVGPLRDVVLNYLAPIKYCKDDAIFTARECVVRCHTAEEMYQQIHSLHVKPNDSDGDEEVTAVDAFEDNGEGYESDDFSGSNATSVWSSPIDFLRKEPFRVTR